MKMKSKMPDWAALHFRVASGGTLTEEEAVFYHVGLEQRENEEVLFFDMEELQKVQNSIRELEAERAQLENERLYFKPKSLVSKII